MRRKEKRTTIHPKRYKLYIRFTALLLVFSLIFTSIPVGCFPASAESATEVTEPTGTEPDVMAEPFVIGEDLSRRGENEKHFLMSDGTRVAALYDTAVHYKDETGTYQEIDNSFDTNGDEYQTKKGKQKTKLAKKASAKKLVTVTREGHTISWGFDGAAKVKGEVLEDAEPTGEDDSAQFAAKNINGLMRYADAFPDVDLEYIVNPDGVKENIILKTAEAQTSFTLYYDIGKLTAQQTNPSTIALLDGDTHCFDLTAPVMLDAEGNQSADLTLTLTEQKNGKLTVILSADAAWLATAAYPVTVDPGFSTQQTSNSLVSKFTFSTDPDLIVDVDNVYNMSNYTFVGDETDVIGSATALYRVQSLPTLTAGDYITSAEFGLVAAEKQNYAVYLSECTDLDWILEDTNGIAGEVEHQTEIIDYCRGDMTVETAGCWYRWNITNLVRKWYETGVNSLNNCGFQLYTYGWCNPRLAFVTTSYSNSNYHPVLAVGYVNHSGVEDYLSYTTADLGDGTAYVNNASGHLTAEIPVLATKGENMPAALTLYYNGTAAGTHSKNKVGHGWRTNYDQRIDAVTNTALKAAGYEYTYTDPDGTVIYLKYNKDTGKHEDDIGAGLSLTVTSTAWTLTDKATNQAVFDTTGKLLRQESATSSATVNFTYDTSGRLTKITDGAGDTITLTRNSSGLVTGITDPYSRTISLTYSSNKLTKITHLDSTTTQFSYTTSNYLSEVISSLDFKTVFLYGAETASMWNHRVYFIEEHSMADSDSNRIDAQIISFGYTVDGTTQVINRSGIGTYLVFDDLGREIGSATDTGASASNYTESNENTATYINNKLAVATSTQMPAENLLLENSFEDDAPWWHYHSDSSYSSITYPTNEVRLGTKAVKLEASAYSTTTHFQKITPPKSGWYTYSVYYKTDGITAYSGEGISALIALVGYDGSKSYRRSHTVTQSTNGEWLRLSINAYVDRSTVKEIHVTNALHYAIGSVYFDCAQLEYSETASDYNMLYNGRFETGTTGWDAATSVTGEGVNPINEVIYAENVPEGFEKSLVFYNGGESTRTATQTVAIHQPANKVVLNFSAYAHAQANKDESATDGTYFSLGIRFYYSNGTNELVTKPFNTRNWSWQHMTGMFTPSAQNRSLTVTSVDAMFMYHKQTNYAEVTGLQLTPDTTGTTYSYDDKGNLISAIDTEENAVSSEYDEQNRLLRKTLQDGATYTYSYDSAVSDRLVSSSVAPKNQKTDYTYNAYGQTTKTELSNATETNGNKITTETSYSTNGKHLIGQTDALGTITNYTYDAYDRTDKIYHDTDDQTDFTQYTYDSVDRTTAVSRQRNASANSAISVGYTYQNNMLSSITHNGFSYLFNYDLFGNTTKIMVGGRTLTQNTYSNLYTTADGTQIHSSGLLTRSTYGNGAQVDYAYDKYGRVTQKSLNGSVKFVYQYDSKGNLVYLKDADNANVYTYTYDSLGRLKHTYRTGANFGITYQYDGSNRVTRKSYGYGGDSISTAYAYDPGGFLTTATFNNGSTRNYTYDSLARVGAMLTKTSNNATIGWETEYSYYNPTEGQTTALVNNINHKTLGLNLNYVYDKFGNIAAIKENNVLKASYEYDNLHQLTRENNTYTGKTVVYDYDNGGNILSKTTYDYTTGSLDGLTGTVVQYAYGDAEWKDLLTAYNGQSITYDEIGNPLTYRNGMVFSWIMGRQLHTAITPDHSDIAYRYNEGGVRIQKRVDGTITTFVLDGTNVIAQNTNGTKYYFEYDANGQRHSMTYGGQTYYYYYNAQGDVIGLYDTNLNSVVQYTYDSWGKVLSVTGSMADTLGSANPFRYRGYYYDTETGLYYLNSRYYDPITGRFINGDGLLSTGQGVLGCNMFAYCGNSPINQIDPNGRIGIFAALAFVAGIVATAVLLSGCSSSSSQSSKSSSNSSKKETKKKSPSSSSTASKHKPSTKEKLYAATVYAEAGGQNKRSKQAVAHVMNNRIGTKSSWTDIEAVISAPYQFEGYNSPMYKAAMDYYDKGICDNPIDQAAMDECLAVVIPIYSGAEADITGGALYFHSCATPEGWEYHNSLTQVYVPGTEKFWFYK